MGKAAPYKGTKITPQVLIGARAMLKNGESQRTVAKTFSLSLSGLQYALDGPARHGRMGRPDTLTPAAKARALAWLHKEQRTGKWNPIAKQAKRVCNLKCTVRTRAHFGN